MQSTATEWGLAGVRLSPHFNHLTCKLFHKLRKPTDPGTQACLVDIHTWLLVSLPPNPVFPAKPFRLAWGIEGKTSLNYTG